MDEPAIIVIPRRGGCPRARNTGLPRRGKVPWSWLPGPPLRGIPECPPMGWATMIVQAILFYIFAVVAVASGVLVVSARNPVHSVLFLILAFFNAAGMFILIGAEFLAMILVIVYVGAVAVLFLFVVMMLDIDF